MGPIRFSLTTLLMLTTLVSVLLASMKLLHPLSAGTLVLFCCAVFAHVAGNAIGSNLRDQATHGDGPGSALNTLSRPYPGKVNSSDFAPATQLRHKAALGKTIIGATIFTMLAGALGGAVWLLWANHTSLTTAGLLFGATAFGVIGGLAGFLGSSFLLVLGHAIVQAQGKGKRKPNQS